MAIVFDDGTIAKVTEPGLGKVRPLLFEQRPFDRLPIGGERGGIGLDAFEDLQDVSSVLRDEHIA